MVNAGSYFREATAKTGSARCISIQYVQITLVEHEDRPWLQSVLGVISYDTTTQLRRCWAQCVCTQSVSMHITLAEIL